MTASCDHFPSLDTPKGMYPNCVRCGVAIQQIPGWWTVSEARKMVALGMKDIDPETGEV